MKLKITGLCAAILLALALPVSAQDDLPLAGDSRQITLESDSDCIPDADETITEDAEDIIVTFGVYDDGERLLAARGEVDFLFIRTADGNYEGTNLPVLGDDFEYHAILTVESPTEMTAVSETTLFECTTTATRRYERLEREGSQLWMETVREVTDISVFEACEGLMNIPVPEWILFPDFLVAIRFDEEEGLAYYERVEYEEHDGDFVRVEDNSNSRTLPHIATFTLEIVSDEQITHSLSAIFRESEDCQVVYSGTLVPFTGDFEALDTLIAETLEAAEAP